MLNTLTGRRLRGPEMSSQMDALREDTCRLLLTIFAIGYLAWHVGVTVFAPPADEAPYRTLFPIVATGIAVSYLLLRSRPTLAIWCFLTTSIISTTAGLWLLAEPSIMVLYPIVALAAIVLLEPLAGLVTGGASFCLLYLLHGTGALPFLGSDRLVETGASMLLIVITAWALDRNLVIALDWSLQSYDQALKSAQSAQDHRAQLVQALKQLDISYYRLERASAALETAWKAAEAAERSKSEFVANISHELRTPLNLIVGFSEMVATSPETYGLPLPTPYRADVFAIYRNAQHLLTLTTDVLDLARVGIGRLALVREPTDLGQVVADACGLVREYIAAKGLRLEIATAPDLPLLHVDPLRIRQVLLNLLTNAARFTERGGITVSAALEGDRVLLQVIDTGRGISPNELSRVFDEFQHGDQPQSRQPGSLGGIGLGLPISRRLIELHGGEMGVESDLGAGTTFWVRLPVGAVDGGVSDTSGRPLRRPHLASSGERVLILLSDDSALPPFLRRHLRHCRLVVAPDAARAAALAIESRASAILADLDELPANGAAGFPVPVFRLPLPQGRRIASALGVVACLPKPVSRQDLGAAIEGLDLPIRKVLVADDDPNIVRLVSLMLRTLVPAEATVITAHNGTDALSLMAERAPDLVLLDLKMPELGGDEVVAAMAADPRLASIPVIVISGRDQPEWSLPLHGEIQVVRPEGFRLEELLGAVEALLDSLDPPRGYLEQTPP